MEESNADITIYAYDRNAEKYAEKFMSFEPYREKLLTFQQRYIPENAHILDLGCGPGNNVKILLSKNESYKITGIDLSVEMISLARKNVPSCHFLVQDIRTLTPEKKYDVIVASFCIVHLSQKETDALVQKIAEIITEKGSLYLSFMEGKKSGLEKTSFSEDEIFFAYYERETILKLLAENSIETVEIFNEDYQEQDGSVTTDVFIFARKNRNL